MGYKTIKRDPISGQHVPVDIKLGKSYSATELAKLAEQRNQEMLDATAKDGHAMVKGNHIQHVATDKAVDRMNNEPGRWQPEHSEKQYNAVHRGDPNKQPDDTGELSNRSAQKGRS